MWVLTSRWSHDQKGHTEQSDTQAFQLASQGPLLDGASLYQLLEEERCTLSAAVPTVFLGLLQYLRDTEKRLTHLKCITIGGAACPPLLIQAFQEDYGVEMRHMWGETNTHTAMVHIIQCISKNSASHLRLIGVSASSSTPGEHCKCHPVHCTFNVISTNSP